VRLAPVRLQRLFELVERRARQADHLLSAADHVDRSDPRGADDHDVAVIVLAVGRGPARQSGVGCLADDDHVGGDARLQHLPLLEQRAGPHHRHDLALAEPEPRAVAARILLRRQHVLMPDDFRQRMKESLLPRADRLQRRGSSAWNG